MMNQEQYDALDMWQKASVDRAARNDCMDTPLYRLLSPLRDGINLTVAEAADTIMNQMFHDAIDEVLADPEFMESITTEAETRFMTRGNNRVR